MNKLLIFLALVLVLSRCATWQTYYCSTPNANYSGDIYTYSRLVYYCNEEPKSIRPYLTYTMTCTSNLPKMPKQNNGYIEYSDSKCSIPIEQYSIADTCQNHATTSQISKCQDNDVIIYNYDKPNCRRRRTYKIYNAGCTYINGKYYRGICGMN